MKNVRAFPVHHSTSSGQTMKEEPIAEETLIRIVVDDVGLVNLLGSPEHSRELAFGHLMTEHGLNPEHVQSVDVNINERTVEVGVVTNGDSVFKSRTGIVTSSCGACDQSGLSELTKMTQAVSDPASLVHLDDILERLHAMRDQQTGFRLTGGMHAAGLYSLDGQTHLVMEDIGRHNAVDKAYGAWHQHTSEKPSILLLSGRCGWDIVAKAATMDTPIIACFGAASSLAVETARASNMTLITFVKGDKAVIIGPVEGRFHRKH